MKFAQGDRVRITSGRMKGLEGTVWSVAEPGGHSYGDGRFLYDEPNPSCEVVFNRNLSGAFCENQMEFCGGHPAEGFVGSSYYSNPELESLNDYFMKSEIEWEVAEDKKTLAAKATGYDSARIVGNPYYKNEKGEWCKIPDSDFCADCGQHGQAHGPHSDQVQHHFRRKEVE